ncbi:hypothetical protein WNY63_16490 [Pseudoalteromonas neustonica]|uniref:CAAX prenyl protease 1 N-terminal domain-containing protein n=1 Tax=Pseudoalteromonas neustonica TaxID=1840331 RepID=A0ABU9U5L6_9GAMM
MMESKRIKILMFFGEIDIFRSIIFWFIVFLLFVIHLLLTICMSNIDYIGSLGAVLTVFGLLASFTHSLYPSLKEELKDPYQTFNNGLFQLTYHTDTSFVIDSNFRSLVNPQEAETNNKKYTDMVKRKYKGLLNTYLLTIIGTFIWAYAGYFEFVLLSFTN